MVIDHNNIPPWNALTLYQTGDLIKIKTEVFVATDKAERFGNDCNLNQDPTGNNGHWKNINKGGNTPQA